VKTHKKKTFFENLERGAFFLILKNMKLSIEAVSNSSREKICLPIKLAPLGEGRIQQISHKANLHQIYYVTRTS